MTILAGKNDRCIPRWFWTIFVGIPLGVMAGWFLRWFFLPSYKRTAAVEIETPRSSGIEPAVKKDDFQILKGIGPKTASGLYQAGIFTFRQLALLEEEILKEVLQEANLPTRGLNSWQEGAALAAAEDWEGLQELQS